MKNEYVIINKAAIQRRIEELNETIDYAKINNLDYVASLSELLALKNILCQSTPLIPEIEKAFTKGERYGWETQKSIGNIEQMKEKIKLQSLDDYISNLKLDI